MVGLLGPMYKNLVRYCVPKCKLKNAQYIRIDLSHTYFHCTLKSTVY